MLHTYQPREIATCMQDRDRRLAFIGGTTTRHLYDAVARKLDPQYQPSGLSREANSIITINGVRLQFVWDPSLQSAELKQIQDGFTDEHARPALTVVGLGHDYIREQTDLTQWAARVGALVSGFSGDADKRARQSDAMVLAPVLDPNRTALRRKDADELAASRVDAMNDALAVLSAQYDVNTAFAFNEIINAPGAFAEDGLTPVPRVSAAMADVLLNMRCNAQLPKHYPYASTCCNTYPRPSWVQLMGFAFVGFLVPCALILSRGGNLSNGFARKLMPPAKFHAPLIVMGLAVALSYYCDRTNIFGKEQKQTDPSQFLIGMSILIAGSLFTLETAEKDLPFLNRDQTDEWKGWMQVAILVYHYVGVSKTPWIYNVSLSAFSEQSLVRPC